MQTLNSTLDQLPFKVPPPEVRARMDREAREAEREERKRNWVAKLRAANVPPEFKDADLTKCDPAVAEWVHRVLDGSTRNLILQGNPGTSKTYSACASLLALLEQSSGRFTRETQLMHRIRDAISGKDSESAVIEYFSSPRVLVLDDFGKVQHRDWSLPILWEILDNRYTWRRPTIFTMQLDSKVLAARLSTENDPGYTAAAIIDRMKDSDVVTTSGSSRRGQRA